MIVCPLCCKTPMENAVYRLCSTHQGASVLEAPALDSHYSTLSPEPIEVLEKWGLTLPFACGTILKLVARIWSTHRPDQPAQGYQGRGGLEDIQKIRFYVDQLEKCLLGPSQLDKPKGDKP